MKRSPIMILTVAVGIATISGVGGFLLWSQQPSRGTIIHSAEETTGVKGSSITQESFNTQFFDTVVSSNFKMKTKNEAASPSILGQYLLTDKDIYKSGQLAITIGVAKDNNLDEVSPVKLRRTFPNEYTEVISEPGYPAGSVTFVKQPDFEKSVFWIHDGRYVAVVVSGGIENQESLNDSLLMTLTSWQWK